MGIALSPSDFNLRTLGGNVVISPPISDAELRDEIEIDEGVLEGGGKFIDVEEPLTDTDGGLQMELEEAEKAIEGGLLMGVKESDIDTDGGLLTEVVEPDRHKGGQLLTDAEELKRDTHVEMFTGANESDSVTGGVLTKVEDSDFLIAGGLLEREQDSDFGVQPELLMELVESQMDAGELSVQDIEALIDADIEDPAGGELMDNVEVNGGEVTCGVDGSEEVATDVGH